MDVDRYEFQNFNQTNSKSQHSNDFFEKNGTGYKKIVYVKIYSTGTSFAGSSIKK